MKTWKYFNEAEFIYNGASSDPELKYKGKTFNYYSIEDTIYESFKEFAMDQNMEVTDENFEAYCKENQDHIKEVFENISAD